MHNRPSATGTANEQGNGLGLSLVKELMEVNGGTVTVISNVGEGTTVTLTFAAV
nr:ATP-binding protein [Spirosoma aerolatum]